MPGFVLTNAAKADLKAIGRYTATDGGREQRNNYLALLDETFHTLAANRLNGRDCGAVRPGYRKQKVGRHIIFFRAITGDDLEIVRILHERMDVERHLSEPAAD